VSWNHAQEYDTPTFAEFGGGQGDGHFEKVYDLGVMAPRLPTPDAV